MHYPRKVLCLWSIINHLSLWDKFNTLTTACKEIGIFRSLELKILLSHEDFQISTEVLKFFLTFSISFRFSHLSPIHSHDFHSIFQKFFYTLRQLSKQAYPRKEMRHLLVFFWDTYGEGFNLCLFVPRTMNLVRFKPGWGHRIYDGIFFLFLFLLSGHVAKLPSKYLPYTCKHRLFST